MRRSVFLLSTVLALAAVSPWSARADFIFAEPPSTADDVYLWPAGLHLGYGHTFDAERGAHAFTLGLDLFTIAYDALLIDVASVRVAFRDGCAGERSGCGVEADLFVGSRVAYALYLGDHREHQLSFGGGLGWGLVAGGFSGRPSTGDGQLLLAPSVRYAIFGFLGVEIAVLLPLTDPIGESYPAALMINVIGLPGLLIAAAGGGL